MFASRLTRRTALVRVLTPKATFTIKAAPVKSTTAAKSYGAATKKTAATTSSSYRKPVTKAASSPAPGASTAAAPVDPSPATEAFIPPSTVDPFPSSTPAPAFARTATRPQARAPAAAAAATPAATAAAYPSSLNPSQEVSLKADSRMSAAEVWESFDDTPESVSAHSTRSAQVSDWATSFSGLGTQAFSREVANVLLAATPPEDIEITPDGLLYLPEIRYRRALNRAFGPGGWGLAPRSQTVVTPKTVSREYGLICQGRLVAVARGEQQYFNPDGVPTAIEGCKSNAMMRCCKDLGIASELWDPKFIRRFKKEQCDTKFHEKKRRFVWKRKDEAWEFPNN